MRILAADDEPLALEELVGTIKEVNSEAEVVSFGSPRKLLEYVKEYPVDVAFLDIEMGSMSGVDVAKQLKVQYPKVNIVFVTGYDQYMHTAIHLRASGYLLKPVQADEVREELRNLRNPILPEKKKILTARCFGTFDAFVNGESLNFERKKTKELLAYLIDRRGSSVTSGELRAVLWGDVETDANTMTYLSKVKKDLLNTLKQAGVDDCLKISWGKYSVIPDKIDCDYYDYLNGNPEGVRAYNGEYMSQYSWGEIQNVLLQDKI